MMRVLLFLLSLAVLSIEHYPGSALPPLGEVYPDLPWAHREIESLSSVLDADVYTDADATEERFKALAPSYSIVHLATHAIVSDSEPAYSKLILNHDYGSGEDGFLYAHEVYGLNLNADLIVLGACQSGTGKFVRGEGIVGLTHAFLSAGCSSVIMSLWAIDDKATAGLMTEFYRGVKSLLPIDVALHEAKLYMINGQDPVLANPYYWSGITAMGRTGSALMPLSR